MNQEHEPTPAWLLGSWRLLRAEQGVELLAETRMEFRATGELVYTIPYGGQQARFTLRYRIRGGLLHTEHEQGGHAAAAGFRRDASGMLEIDFAGRRAWFLPETRN